jgi:hypothetical protein
MDPVSIVYYHRLGGFGGFGCFFIEVREQFAWDYSEGCIHRCWDARLRGSTEVLFQAMGKR